GCPADDVRREDESRSAGRQRRSRILQGESVSDRHPPQCAAWRGAKSRDARDLVRREIPRSGGVPRTRPRNAGAYCRKRRLKTCNLEPSMDKRPALGKGLSALIPDTPEPRMA